MVNFKITILSTKYTSAFRNMFGNVGLVFQLNKFWAIAKCSQITALELFKHVKKNSVIPHSRD